MKVTCTTSFHTTFFPVQDYWTFFDIPPKNGFRKSIKATNKEGYPVELVVNWLAGRPTYVRIVYHTEARPVFVGQIDVENGRVHETPASVLTMSHWHVIANRMLAWWRAGKLKYEVLE